MKIKAITSQRILAEALQEAEAMGPDRDLRFPRAAGLLAAKLAEAQRFPIIALDPGDEIQVGGRTIWVHTTAALDRACLRNITPEQKLYLLAQLIQEWTEDTDDTRDFLDRITGGDEQVNNIDFLYEDKP